MLSRKSVQTLLINGERRLAYRKTGQYLNWLSRKVAEQNALKYEKLLGQPVQVKSYNRGTFTVHYLVVENFIA